jgi:hypothetical protein
MTATFSTYALEAMGFRDLIARGSLAASFMSVTVYETRGITLPEGFADAREARVAGANYRVALCKSVNAGSQHLIGDNFAESESEWLKEVKAAGPFVLIAVGPTDFIECEAGRMMRMPGGSITTYDSFPGLRDTLRSLEGRVLPPVVATLTLALNEPDRYVALRKLACASAGRTTDGTTVHDIRLDLRADLTVSRSLGEARAVEVLDASIKRAPKLHQRAAKYFALGTAEDDQLKKFLYFFLSLEVETHAVFGRIDHAKSLRNQVLRDGTSSPRPSAADLISRDVAQWDNLFDRFVWCATCAWPSLADEDVKLFKELKNARDAIAHGRASGPPTDFARKAELLAHKILWVHGAGDA